MKWPNTFTWVRHGKSKWNELKQNIENDPLWPDFLKEYERNYRSPQTKKLARSILGRYKPSWSDEHTPLSDLGEIQSIKTGPYLKDLIKLPDVVYVSTFLRCRQTYQNLCVGWPELKAVQVYFDERVIERDVGIRARYGHWKIFNVFNPEQKEFYDELGPTAYYRCRYPQGENVPDVMRRVHELFDTVIREYAGCEVLVISHGVCIMSMRATLERMSPEEFVQLDKTNSPKNCSVTIYKGNAHEGLDGKLELVKYNEVAPIWEKERF